MSGTDWAGWHGQSGQGRHGGACRARSGVAWLGTSELAGNGPARRVGTGWQETDWNVELLLSSCIRQRRGVGRILPPHAYMIPRLIEFFEPRHPELPEPHRPHRADPVSLRGKEYFFPLLLRDLIT